MGMEIHFLIIIFPRSAKFTQFLVKGVSSVKQIPAELLLQDHAGARKVCLDEKDALYILWLSYITILRADLDTKGPRKGSLFHGVFARL